MSKKKLLLVGAGGFGRMVAEQAMLQYDCAFVDDGQSVGAEICGIPVIGGLADLPELKKEYSLLVVGIGNNQFRAQVYEKAKSLGYAFPNIIAPSAHVSPSVCRSRLWLCGAAKRLYPEWSLCRKRCFAECRNGSPL